MIETIGGAEMTYQGHVENGSVVLDDDVTLPEGARVEVRVAEPGPVLDTAEPLGRRLLRHAGTAVDLPADASVNHDHYLYGTPKT
jgi:hypothetical protein